MKKVFEIMLFCLGFGGRTPTGRDAVRTGLLNFGGQGRDRFGR